MVSQPPPLAQPPPPARRPPSAAASRNRSSFRQVALSVEPVTDKVTSHSYETMYDIFLGRAERPLKLLEIGLGCNMRYGPGSSARVWHRFLPAGSELWGAEIDDSCVRRFHFRQQKEKDAQDRTRFVVGDQSSETTLMSWVEATGGEFDAIVDDGGHKNFEILQALRVLWWRALKPGGVYFIEDLQVSRNQEYQWNQMYGQSANRVPPRDATLVPSVADLIHLWSEELLVGGGGSTRMPTARGRSVPRVSANMSIRQRAYRAELKKQYKSAGVDARWLLPPWRTKFIFCQDEACVLGRCADEDRNRHCKNRDAAPERQPASLTAFVHTNAQDADTWRDPMS